MGLVCHLPWWKNYFCYSKTQDVEKKLGYGEQGVDSELMRMHNLCGPSRFLFTIKEETIEDLDSEEDGISTTTTCTNFWAAEEETGLRSSPPPTFKFLRDAEDKFFMKEAERRRKGLKNDFVKSALILRS